MEDDYFLAAQLCDELRRAGATVLGPAPTPFYAMQLLGRRGADSAVLDIKLHGTTVFGLADELVRQGTPIVFATGYGDDVFPERFRGRPRVTKPYLDQQLIDLLVELDADRNYVELVDATDSGEPANAAPPDSSHARIVRVVAAVIRRNAIAARDA